MPSFERFSEAIVPGIRVTEISEDGSEIYHIFQCQKDALLNAPKELVRCKDCKHGSPYCTEDVCGETLIECKRPDLGDIIEIHRWDWYCFDGDRRE